MQGASKRDVIRVVANRVCERAFLPVSRHAAIDQPFVPRHALGRPESQPFHDTRAKALEYRVGVFAESQHEIGTFLALQIHRNGWPTAVHEVVPGRHRHPEIVGHRAVQPDQLCAHVGEQHAAELARADAGDLDDFVPC